MRHLLESESEPRLERLEARVIAPEGPRAQRPCCRQILGRGGVAPAVASR